MSTINERLIELRTCLNLNQESFGKRISLVRSGISNMEKGIRNVSDRTIKLICKEYNVNEEWLRNGTGEIFKNEEELLETLGEHFDSLSEIDKKIIVEYVKLSPNKRKIMIDFFKNVFGV